MSVLGSPVFFVESTDIETLGCLQSIDGIFSEGPIRGDIIEQDWLPGAIWQRGEPGTYSFDVPLALSSPDPAHPYLYDPMWVVDVIKTWRGPQLTLERRVPLSGGTFRRETCQAVLVSPLPPNILGAKFARVVLVFQNLSGQWNVVSDGGGGGE